MEESIGRLVVRRKGEVVKKSFKVFVPELNKEVLVETKGKKGIYQVSFSHRGLHIRRSLKASNKIQAEQNLRPVIRKFLATVVTVTPMPQLDSDPAIGNTGETVVASFDWGLENYLDSMRDRNCGPRDIQQAKTRVSVFIAFMESMGFKSFDEVQPIHADLFFRGLVSGAFKAPKGKDEKEINTAVGYFRFVKACMEYLASRRLISSNPWASINLSRVDHVQTPKPRLEELNLILANIEPAYFVAANGLAFQGCRSEALLRTQPNQVSLTGGYVEFIPPLHRSKTVRRKVPIHPRLMKVLREYDRPDSEYYFCTIRNRRQAGGNKMPSKDLNNAIKRAAKKAGFPAGRKEGGFVAHSLRGFFKSHCIKQGVPREVVDCWQGHSDGTIGTKHYFDLTLEESIEFMKKVDFGSY